MFTLNPNGSFVLLTCLAPVAVAVSVVLAIAFMPSREPSYAGKRMSEWIEEPVRLSTGGGPHL